MMTGPGLTIGFRGGCGVWQLWCVPDGSELGKKRDAENKLK
jgi:hypothetical protein